MSTEILYLPTFTGEHLGSHEIQAIGYSGEKEPHRPYIKTMIPSGGKNVIVNFMVDTGAAISYLTPKDSKKLGIIPENCTPFDIQGITGTVLHVFSIDLDIYLKGELKEDENPHKLLLRTKSPVLVSAKSIWPESILGWTFMNNFGLIFDRNGPTFTLQSNSSY